MDGATIGKLLIGVGIMIAVVGGGVWLASRAGISLGKLPGDIRVERETSTFYFPIVTCIVLSVVLTVAANLLLRLFR